LSAGELVYVDVGRKGYRPTLEMQHRLLARVQGQADDRAYLVLVEHDPPVITMGRRARDEHVLIADDLLAARGIERIESRRGGDVTYHGPGQIVAYPIVRLARNRRTVHGYVRSLEEAVIRLLAALGLIGRRRPGHTGVWVGPEKIAAIGVAVSRWVTYHGLALNVGADLQGFDAIVPCGIRGSAVTSLARRLGREVPMAQVKGMLVDALGGALDFASARRASLRELGLDRPSPRLPRWMRKPIPTGRSISTVAELLRRLDLPTVCHSAKCPNRPECFARGTAAFMILGDRCTRSCRFCAVNKGPPPPVDNREPQAVAEACLRLGLRHVVITSVTRDDLPDGGAGHFACVTRAVRSRLPEAVIEILTPDFGGETRAIDTALAGGCNVFNHNIETAERLYPAVRPQGDYRRSLSVLRHVGQSRCDVHTKSGIMVGLGETREEIRTVMRDLREAGCEILTVGQYLSPSRGHHPIERFVEPKEFVEIDREARDLGFSAVMAGPFVRSSYHAEDLLPTDWRSGMARTR